MTYEQALAYIAALEPRGWRLGLDRMQEFVHRAGLDQSIGNPSGPQFIHVAGTNGKGSTTAFLQSILVESGYRTGSFFSPFVVDPRERVQFGRELIGKQELADLTEALIPVADSLTDSEFGGITEFEFKTAIGFQYWKQRHAEWVALEVGLGGRLDATSVVTPRASIIVSIGLDHMHILGDTRAKIAFEKAGVIKPGVPVIVGDLPPDALEVVTEVAQANTAPIWRWGHEVLWDKDQHAVTTPNGTHSGLFPSLVGQIQEHNLTLAVAALDAAGALKDEESIQTGAAAATIPGRFQRIQYRGRTILLDGAHNPDALAVLRQALEAEYGAKRCILVTNMLQGHEPEQFFVQLKDQVSTVHVVPISFHRSTPVPDMVEHLQKTFSTVTGHESVMDGVDAAVAESQPDDIVLVTGSFYMVGEVIRGIGG